MKNSDTDYLFQIENGILVIIDLNLPGKISVTNNIKQILLDIKEEIKTLPDKIIYRDSSGEFDGVEHVQGNFIRFYPIRETDLHIALNKVKQITNC